MSYFEQILQGLFVTIYKSLQLTNFLVHNDFCCAGIQRGKQREFFFSGITISFLILHQKACAHRRMVMWFQCSAYFPKYWEIPAHHKTLGLIFIILYYFWYNNFSNFCKKHHVYSIKGCMLFRFLRLQLWLLFRGDTH